MPSLPVMSMPRLLHVANGSSTTNTIEAAGLPGVCSIWADPLHEGPVPAVDDAELVGIREAFLGPPPQGGPGLREWRLAVAQEHTYDELVLWFEHDLFDQLNLIHVLTWINHRGLTKPVSLICIGSFPGRPHFKGLGELTPAELAPLLDTRQPVGDAQYEIARRAWQAFCEPTPERLDGLRATDTAALPFLGAALTRFLEEYPWTRDGLSRSERRLLELGTGGIDLLRAFPRMSEGESAYYVTDGTLAGMAQDLARTSPPLLTIETSPSPAAHILAGRITTTAAGMSVLAGTLDRVAACGIDRWFGGVHLRGREGIWRWDDSRRRVVRPQVA